MTKPLTVLIASISFVLGLPGLVQDGADPTVPDAEAAVKEAVSRREQAHRS